MNRLRLNNKGLTLIEVIVTIAIIAMMIPVLYLIVSISNKSFTSTRDRGLAQQEARIVAEHLNNELRYASKITSHKNGLSDKYFSLSVVNNDLVKSEYNGNDKTLEKKLVTGDWSSLELKHKDGIIIVNIVIEENNNSDYQLTINIPLENIKDASNIELGITDLVNNEIFYIPISQTKRPPDLGAN